MTKKLLSMSIVLVMICSMFCVMQVSAATFDAEYNFNDTTTNFDPSADTTDAFIYHGNLPTFSYGKGFTGGTDDSALKMSIEPAGKTRTGVTDFFSISHEFGFSVRADSADATITDSGNAAYAFNANFKAAHEDVVAALIYPELENRGPRTGNSTSGYTYRNSVIYLYKGKLYVGTTGHFQPETDTCIAEPGVGNWFTLGAVFSTTHKRFDVFYNGTRIYGETRSVYTGINRWHIYMNSSNETSHMPYDAGEFLYIDNLYVGKDFTKVKGYYIEVVSNVPAKDATGVALDSDFTFNFSIPARTDKLPNGIAVTPAAEYTTEWSNGNQTLTLKFTGLQPDTTYTVALGGSNFQSFVYEAAKSKFSTTFKTKGVTDVTFYSGTGDDMTPVTNTAAGTITVQGTVTLLEDSAQIIVARYSGGTLADVKVLDAITNETSNTFTTSLTGCAAGDTIKVFSWKSLKDLVPLGAYAALYPNN